MRTILVAGFGPFGDVTDNPASRIARAVDGRVVDGVTVCGREMPVSYRRSIDEVTSWTEELGVRAVIGVGVAMDRSEVVVERTAVRPGADARLDIDGLGPLLGDGPSQVRATIDVKDLAAGLGALVGDDAGRYVCNAWLYEAVVRLGGTTPVGFVHVPPAGIAPARLLEAIARGWGVGRNE